MEPEEEGFGPAFWGMLFLGIVGVIGFLLTAGGAALGG